MKSKVLTYQNTSNIQTNNNGSKSGNVRNSLDRKCMISSKIEKDRDSNNNNEENFHDSADEKFSLKINQNLCNGNNLNNNDCIDKLSEQDLAVLKSLDINSKNSNSVVDNISINGNHSENNEDEQTPETDENRTTPQSCCVSNENKTNLIVNYLPQNMSQEEMRDLFASLGEVESCKLVRDKTTGQSLSYGFVNYLEAKDASNAIRRFNGMRLQNKVIKVSLARPSSETIKGANLYICGLPKSMSHSELEQLFSQYGTIITCRILIDNTTGNSKGVAFIRFDQRQEAETAIKKLNGFVPQNGTEPITVKLANTPFNINNSQNNFQPSCNSNQGEYNNSSCNLLNGPGSQGTGVRNLMSSMRSMVTTGSDMLSSHLPPPPNVLNPDYVQNSAPGIPVSHPMTFPTGQMMCPPQMHPIVTFPMSFPAIQHPSLQSIAVQTGASSSQTTPLVPPSPGPAPSTFISLETIPTPTHILDPNGLCGLFVYNLGPDTKEATLWQTFGPFGAVHSVNLARDPTTGKCRGFGFVTMPNYHEALIAIQHLNGQLIDNRTIQIAISPNIKVSPVGPFVLPP